MMLKLLVCVLTSVFLISPAFAAETQIDFTATLTGPNGVAQQDCDHVNENNPQAPFCDKFVPLTLGRLAAAALDQIEPNLKPEDIVVRGSLARRIRDSMSPLSSTHGKLGLDPRDIDLIRGQLAKMRENPSIIDEAYDLLTPSPATK
jgi:hypothetical protein